jgi:hypothetical protein
MFILSITGAKPFFSKMTNDQGGKFVHIRTEVLSIARRPGFKLKAFYG